MTDPTMAAITTYDDKVQAYDTGACREFWIRIPGLSGASDQDSGGNDDLYYLLNPFAQDMVILNALAVVTTLGTDGDIDVGLADDAEGTNVGCEVIDSLVHSAAAVHECTAVNSVVGGSKAIWRKSGTSTDSYLVVTQNTDADASALRWHLLLKLIPYEDLIGDEGTQATLVQA